MQKYADLCKRPNFMGEITDLFSYIGPPKSLIYHIARGKAVQECSTRTTHPSHQSTDVAAVWCDNMPVIDRINDQCFSFCPSYDAAIMALARMVWYDIHLAETVADRSVGHVSYDTSGPFTVSMNLTFNMQILYRTTLAHETKQGKACILIVNRDENLMTSPVERAAITGAVATYHLFISPIVNVMF